jgi:amino acid transporter
MSESRPKAPVLKRSLSTPLLVLYGLGTTVGAGIYVLIGEVAAQAGSLAPVSFVAAALLAAPTAFAFAELSSRYPRSAGEAVYVSEGLPLPGLALIVGLAVASVGILSSAAIANGFVGYARQFVDLPGPTLIVMLVCILAVIAAWGISESVALASIITLIEVGGLLVIVFVGASADPAPVAPTPSDVAIVPGILAGAILAFYAFLGFEDMVNVAEEVRDAPRTVPRAIIVTLILTALLYAAVSIVAVRVVPLATLANAEAPLSLVFTHATGGSANMIGAIGAIAVVNGALIQIIMASRVLYGLGSQGWLPAAIARLHPRTRTPVLATFLVAVCVLVLALSLSLVRLAEVTSLVTLGIFALINLALWRIKLRDAGPVGGWSVPLWLPVVGFVVSAGFVIYHLTRSLF